MDRSGALRRVAWWLAVVAIVAIAIPVAARALGWEPGPLALLVAFMPWVTLACVLPLLLAALARSWVLGAIAGVLAMVCVYWMAPLYIGGGGGGEPVVTMATVNMTFGGADADAVVAMVREHQVDVLAVVELTPDAADALADAGLGDELPFSEVLAEPGVPGTGLWSRFELTGAEDVSGFFSHTIRATVAGPVGQFDVFAVHPQAPGSRNHDNWAADLRLLRDVLASVDGPVIVAGDFNTTRDHAGFRDIEALGYVDAADRIDAGFRPTFPENRELFPLVPIDHVLTRDVPLRPATFDTVAIPGADHRALIVGYTPSGGP